MKTPTFWIGNTFTQFEIHGGLRRQPLDIVSYNQEEKQDEKEEIMLMLRKKHRVRMKKL